MPLPHQEAIHRDTHKLIGNFGGYGTGKSLTDYQDLVKHILITPNADAMVAANISYQYEQTVKKELEKDIPESFVDVYSVKNQRMVLKNGAVIQYRPLDDPNKLRSNNLSYFLVIEGSETESESFHQLKTRLRNNAATLQAMDNNGDLIWEIDSNGRQIPVIAHDWRKGIVESNPDAGWIKNDMLLVSDKISQYGKNNDHYDQEPGTIDKDISSHIATTHVNTFLPKGYIDMICKNKPEWWINRFVNSSFLYAEGLVYPNIRKCIIPWFDIEQAGKNWKRICAFDYGLSDNAVFIFGAVDEQAGLLYIYKEIVMNNNNIEELAKAFKAASADIPIGGWITQPIMDPKSNKRDFNKKDLATHFLDYGIAFKPGHVSIDARVLRLNTYIETDHIRILDNCNYLIGEITDYKFEERTLDNKKRQVKPEDKNNHAVNPVEWICMELPSNPANLTLGVYNINGLELSEIADKNKGVPYQLQDDVDLMESSSMTGFEVPDYEF